MNPALKQKPPNRKVRHQDGYLKSPPMHSLPPVPSRYPSPPPSHSYITHIIHCHSLHYANTIIYFWKHLPHSPAHHFYSFLPHLLPTNAVPPSSLLLFLIRQCLAFFHTWTSVPLVTWQSIGERDMGLISSFSCHTKALRLKTSTSQQGQNKYLVIFSLKFVHCNCFLFVFNFFMFLFPLLVSPPLDCQGY